MYRHLLLILTMVVTMVLGNHGTAHAASPSRDKLQKVEHHEPLHNAVLSDTASLYRICNARPERLVPHGWSSDSPIHPSKLPYKFKFYQSLFTTFHGKGREESAPIHFDVASKYYVVCLRHLLC